MAVLAPPAPDGQLPAPAVQYSRWSWMGAAAGLAVLLLLAASISTYFFWFPVGALLGVLVLAWCVQRPSRWLYLLIATIYLESADLSLYVAGARVRAAQLLLAPIVANLALQGILGRVRFRRVPLFVPLLIYLGCNYAAAGQSPVPQQCVKIVLLLTSLVVLYVAAYTLVRDDPEAWPSIFRFFVIVGLAEVGYGVYQVAAGYANSRLGMSLPIGWLGLFQSEFVGTSYGRPYGSLPEPDTYGAVCVYFALMAGLMWLTSAVPRRLKWLVPVMAVAALIGLLAGIVRAVWFGFSFGLLWSVFMFSTGRLRGVRMLRVTAVLAAVVLGFAGSLTVPKVREVLRGRFARSHDAPEQAFSTTNARFVQMALSWDLFRQRPLLGNGPGSFSVLGGVGAHEFYWLAQGIEKRVVYDPSIVTTVLNDTGVVGMAAFLGLIASYFAHVRRRVRQIADRPARNRALAAHCAFVGLFASFCLTQYFWLPFTWLFLAMTMLLLEFGSLESVAKSDAGPAGTVLTVNSETRS